MVRSRSAGGELSVGVQTNARDDARLLHRIAGGDRRAFEELYRRYHPRLTRFVSNFLRRPDLVEEVVDDTLLAVWRRPTGYSGGSTVSTWIFAIAYRQALKARRRIDEAVEDKQAETRAALLAAMGTLSSDHRAVVDLTYFHEIGYREIAEIMSCPVDTVKTRMFHARRCLKKALPGDLADWL